jgi:hypothetical protein
VRILTFSLDHTRHALIGLWSRSQETLAVAEEYLPVPFGDLEHPLELFSGRSTGRRCHARAACLHQKPLNFWTAGGDYMVRTARKRALPSTTR